MKNFFITCALYVMFKPILIPEILFLLFSKLTLSSCSQHITYTTLKYLISFPTYAPRTTPKLISFFSSPTLLFSPNKPLMLFVVAWENYIILRSFPSSFFILMSFGERKAYLSISYVDLRRSFTCFTSFRFSLSLSCCYGYR